MRNPLRSLLCLLCLATLTWPGIAGAQTITVFAAASLKTALDEVSAAFTAETGTRVRIAYAGTSTLARQIEQGAPADVFVSANTLWMDRLESDGRIASQTRRDLLGNTLVLISARPRTVDLSAPEALADALGEGRLAMALVDAVPAGIYGKAALETLGQWDSVADRIVQTDNVRAALALVALGEAPLGVTYTTDARAEPRVAVAARFPADSHPPIVYPVAAIAGRDGPDVQSYLAFLTGTAARDLFQAQGFTTLAAPG